MRDLISKHLGKSTSLYTVFVAALAAYLAADKSTVEACLNLIK